MSILRKIWLAMSPRLEVRCPEHPHYQGYRLPKVECDGCYLIYRNTEELRNVNGIKTHKLSH